MKNAYKILVRKVDGKIPLRGPRHRQEDKRLDLRDIGWEVVDWMHANNLGQGPTTGSCKHGNEPSGSIKGREFLN
jgi:hypothetical protein